ncbi:hypothetical protein Btru_022556 [Bulinus truncatus]|nr:hypothetical protein Btru_022556 [Bulinus truncatus]
MLIIEMATTTRPTNPNSPNTGLKDGPASLSQSMDSVNTAVDDEPEGVVVNSIEDWKVSRYCPGVFLWCGRSKSSSCG